MVVWASFSGTVGSTGFISSEVISSFVSQIFFDFRSEMDTHLLPFPQYFLSFRAGVRPITISHKLDNFSIFIVAHPISCHAVPPPVHKFFCVSRDYSFALPRSRSFTICFNSCSASMKCFSTSVGSSSRLKRNFSYSLWALPMALS